MFFWDVTAIYFCTHKKKPTAGMVAISTLPCNFFNFTN